MSRIPSHFVELSDDSVSVCSQSAESVVSTVSSITMEPELFQSSSTKKSEKKALLSLPPALKAKKTVSSSDSSSATDKQKKEVRKGKWMPEEERFTNKVIEYFNAGLLKLDGADKNVTLRSYLADKLQCDPMRITKKFTGAACLGKRVYHFDCTSVAAEDVDKAMKELQILEDDFRKKLEQASKKRSHEESAARYDESLMVSTPAIDALVKRQKVRAQKQSRGAVTVTSTPLSTSTGTTSGASCASSGAAVAQQESSFAEHMPFFIPLPQQFLQQQQLLYFQKLQQMHEMKNSQLTQTQQGGARIPVIPVAVQLQQLQQLALLHRDVALPHQ